MTVRNWLDNLDDETWVGLDLPSDEGGRLIVIWNADYVGAYGPTMEEIGGYLDRETYDAYIKTVESPETCEDVPCLIIPVGKDTR